MLDAGTTTGRLYYSSPQRLADVVTRRRALTRAIYTGRIRRAGSPVDEPVAIRSRLSDRTVPPEFARHSAHTGQGQLLPMPGRSCGPGGSVCIVGPVRQMLARSARPNFPSDRVRQRAHTRRDQLLLVAGTIGPFGFRRSVVPSAFMPVQVGQFDRSYYE